MGDETSRAYVMVQMEKDAGMSVVGGGAQGPGSAGHLAPLLSPTDLLALPSVLLAKKIALFLFRCSIILTQNSVRVWECLQKGTHILLLTWRTRRRTGARRGSLSLTKPLGSDAEVSAGV